MRHINVIWELVRAGAGRGEAVRLSGLAGQLGSLPVPHLGAERTAAIAARIGIEYRRPLGGSLAGVLALGVAALSVLVLVAQSASPGSPLYSLRRGTNFVQSIVGSEPSATPQASSRPNDVQPRTTTTASPNRSHTPAPTSGHSAVDDNPKPSPSASPSPEGSDDHGGRSKVKGAATSSPTPTPSNPHSGGKNKP